MVYSRVLLYLSLATTLVFLLSGYGYQWDIWSLGLGFTLLRYSAYTAIGLSIVTLISIWFLRKNRTKVIGYLVISFLSTGLISGAALYWQNRAQSVPRIHDISTDLDTPPTFEAIVRLRADAPNPPEYAGEETRIAQMESYPNILPLVLPSNVQDVLDTAVMLILQRKWNMVAINRNQGRIEATEKLAWFGFKDDVVLRFTETDTGGTRVDMRSKSRIGGSDMGVNARRISRFLHELELSTQK